MTVTLYPVKLFVPVKDEFFWMRVASAMCSTSVTLLALLFFNKVLPAEFEASTQLSPKYYTSDARRESMVYQKLAWANGQGN